MAKVTKTKIGRVMLLNKGTYNVETAYSELDVVKESGRTYICLKNCKGIQPTNTEYWILAADIGISPINKEDYNTEEEKSLYANELSDYGKIALDEYTAEKVEQLIAKEVELEGVLDTEKDKQIGIVNDKAEIYNANAETKTLAFNTNASDKTAVFDTNAETKISAFNTNASEKTSAFNTNASDKTSAFNANAESKTSAFNTNASEKTARFNQNASDKVAEFDDVKNDLLGQADDLFDALTTNEASGTELYIEDAKACRILNTEIDGMYKQETTSGKNLLEVVATSQTINGITFTINKDKTVTVNGTANGNSILILNSFDFQNGETYILNGCPNNGGINSYKLDAFGQTGLSNDIGNGIDINIGGQRNIRIVIFDGNSVNNLVFKPMIIKGSEATEYEPYTGGNPSPNPDYPQEIKQVESVKLEICNQNLFDGEFRQGSFNSLNNLNRCFSKNNIYIETGDYLVITDLDFSVYNYGIIVSDNKFPTTVQNFSYDSGWKKEGKFVFSITKSGNLGINLRKNDNSDITLNMINDIKFVIFKLNPTNIDLKGNKLCAISDTIKDKLLIDKNGNVALQKNVNYSTFQDFQSVDTLFEKSARFALAINNILKNKANMNGFVISNLMKYGEINSGMCFYGTNKNGNLLVSMLYSVLGTTKNDEKRVQLNAANTYLSNLAYTPEVYYAVETPEIIDLGQLPELPKTFNGINNIWAETNLGNTEIEIEYVQDVKKLIEQTQAMIINNASEEVTK